MRVFGQRLYHEHNSAFIWSELFHDSESIWVGGSVKSMIVQVLGLRLFHENNSASIWAKTVS